MKILQTTVLISLISGIGSLVAFGQPSPVQVPPPNAPASAPLSASAPGLPFGAQEVLKMYKGGISKDVIINYVNNTVLPFHLSADGIIYLQTVGLPEDITRTMIQRDGALQTQAARSYQPQQAYSQPPAYGQQQVNPYPPAQGSVPPPQVIAPSTPPPTVGVVGDSSVYAYPYDYDYGYPYYWGGPIVVGGWGWGWGHGYGWGRGGWGGGFHGGGGFRGGGGFGGHGGGGGGHR